MMQQMFLKQALRHQSKNMQPARMFSSGKYDIPTLGEYNQLFSKSGIMEDLLPRQIETADSFKSSFPSILEHSCSGSEITGDSAYDLSDMNAINKVSSRPLSPNIIFYFSL